MNDLDTRKQNPNSNSAEIGGMMKAANKSLFVSFKSIWELEVFRVVLDFSVDLKVCKQTLLYCVMKKKISLALH